MTTKSRLKKIEQKAGGTAYEPLIIRWSEDDPYFYEGREISKEEHDQLVKEGKITVLTWPEGDGEG